MLQTRTCRRKETHTPLQPTYVLTRPYVSATILYSTTELNRYRYSTTVLCGSVVSIKLYFYPSVGEDYKNKKCAKKIARNRTPSFGAITTSELSSDLNLADCYGVLNGRIKAESVMRKGLTVFMHNAERDPPLRVRGQYRGTIIGVRICRASALVQHCQSASKVSPQNETLSIMQV